jgi:hypothetical protein
VLGNFYMLFYQTFSFFPHTGVWSQNLALPRQALCHLSHATVPDPLICHLAFFPSTCPLAGSTQEGLPSSSKSAGPSHIFTQLVLLPGKSRLMQMWNFKCVQSKTCLNQLYNKKCWERTGDSSGRAPALQAWSPEFKPQSYPLPPSQKRGMKKW